MTPSPSPASATAPPVALMQATGIVKDFPGLRALHDVDLTIHSGEIVALVGHNGSGKSTLVKILGGVYRPDAGEVAFAGTGEKATQLHIIHQDLGLIGELSTVENLGISDGGGLWSLAPTRGGPEAQHAMDLVSGFGEGFDVMAPVGSLAPAQRSVVAIARALDGWRHSGNVLILDEPTEALHATETQILFTAVRQVAADGAGVVFISHRLDEVLAIADRIVVLRDGVKVADVPTAGLRHDDLVEYVTGGSSHADHLTRRIRETGEVVLEVQHLVGGSIRGIDLMVRAGEVVGVAGVLGSGRDVLPHLLFGATPAQADRFFVGGREYPHRSPRHSVRRGVAFVAGDRGRFGAVRAMSARENMTLPELRTLTGPVGVLRTGREKKVARSLIERYDVRPARAEQAFSQFSGGNQQKIVFAKWLRNEPRLLLLEEPTQGVDIGAKQAIYDEIDKAADRGVGVVVCSSDQKELVRLCDRVIVLREGVIAVELTGDDLTEANLIVHGYGLAEFSRKGQDLS